MNARRTWWIVLLLAGAAGGAAVVLPRWTSDSLAEPAPDRLVIVISLDGARPDAVAMAETPTLDALVVAGGEAPDARATYPFVTLPNHVAMLTGLRFYQHKVMQNHYTDPMPALEVDSVFDICDRYGLATLMLAGKKKLCMLRPLSDTGPRPSQIVPLERLSAALRDATAESTPSFIFLHSAQPDLAGHASGWMSVDYLSALTRADRVVGQVVSWVRDSDLWSRTLIIVTADHGGFDKTHNGRHPGDTVIPWITSGGLAEGADLPDKVMIYDTAPTALRMLGLPIPAGLDGRAVEGFKTYPDGGS